MSQTSGRIASIKRAVRERDGFRCVLCGMSNGNHLAKYGRQLDVHRKVPRSLYTTDGCETLCRGCHGGKPQSRRGEIDLAREQAQAVGAKCPPPPWEYKE